MTAPHKAQSPVGAGLSGFQNTDSAIVPTDKNLANLIALFALRGFAVHQLTVGGFLVGRWNQTKHCANLAELESFAEKVGVLRHE